jgi:hypothetical protein
VNGTFSSAPGLGQQRLARTGRADQQDVGLGQLDVVVLAALLDALVVVVHRHREALLGARLTDDVLIQHVEDLARLGQVAARRWRPSPRALRG